MNLLFSNAAEPKDIMPITERRNSKEIGVITEECKP